MSTTRTYALRVPSERQNIVAVGPFLDSIQELVRLGPVRLHDLHVAITEAVNNAIIHAHACQPDVAVDISVQTSDTEVVVVVRDYGPGFDPDQVPDPRLPENLLREGGRGVFLIRHLADAVEFRPGDPGMHIMITYSLPV
ncbi:MAG: hypothetical protein RLZZ150_405 [Bacteroidota bacterium]|jgi:serine/threonine-protein kinase RsbW